ncbi:MAG: hypothetical protein KGI50_06290 [Patescibacteria group bacterium]|nr:hypothetical protein [Patescibacteria group bacterium]
MSRPKQFHPESIGIEAELTWNHLVIATTALSEILPFEALCLRDAELLEAAARNIRSKLGVSASASTGA